MGMSAAQLETLVVKLTADTVNYEKGMGRVEKRAVAMSKRFTAIGAKLTMALTLPLLAVGATSAKAFADYDDAMKQSQAIMMDLTPAIAKQMDEQAKTLAGKGVQSATELAEAYYFLTSAGLSAQQSMAALPTVQAFATAGMFDMAKATDLLTDAVTAFGMQQGQMGKMSDVIVHGARLANASVEQFSESLTSDAAASARTYGMTLEQTIGILGAYASAGKKGAEAGNMFGRATRLLTKAERKHGEAFAKYGVDVVDDATGQYRNLALVMQDMENAFDGMKAPEIGAALEEMGFDALAQKALLPLLGQSETMLANQTKLLDANGTTAEVAAKQMQSFGNQLRLMRNQLHVVAVEIGEQLAPGILRMNERIKAGLKWWRTATDAQKAQVVAIGKWVAIAGPAIGLLGMMLGYFAQLVPLMRAATTAATLLGTGMGKAFAVARAGAATALLPLLPYVAAIAAIGAAVAGVAYLLVGKEGMVGAWNKVTATMKDWYGKAVGFMQNWKHNLGVVLAWVQAQWRNVLADMLQLWLIHMKALPTVFMVVVKTIPRLLMVLGGAMNWVWQKLWESDLPKWVWAGVSKIPTLVGKALGFTFDVAMAAVKGIIQLLLEIPKALWEGLRAAGGLIKEMLISLATLDFERMGEAINAAMGTAINTAMDAAGRVATAMGEGIEKAWQGAKDYGNTLVDDFGRAQEDPAAAAAKVLSDAGKEIAGAYAGFERQTKGIDGLRWTGPESPMGGVATALEDVTAQVDGAGTALGKMREKVEKPIDLVFKATNLDGVMKGTADYYAMVDRTRELLGSRPVPPSPTPPQAVGPTVAAGPQAPKATDYMHGGHASTMVQLLERVAVAAEATAEDGTITVTQVDNI